MRERVLLAPGVAAAVVVLVLLQGQVAAAVVVLVLLQGQERPKRLTA